MRKTIFFLLFIFSVSAASAQKSIRDSISFPMVGASFQAQLPGGDMADRFGYNFNVGGFFNFKLKNNWLCGVDGSFIFGNEVRENPISYMMTKDGYVINTSGLYATLSVYERGFHFSGKAGRIFNFFGPNPNSGLMTTIGAGILQHKIRIEEKDNAVPALKGDYRKGYDRLTNGLAITEFIGYVHCSNSRRINFFAGFELTQAFTKSRRDWDFATMMKDDKSRVDLLYGVKVGWFFPIYKHVTTAYYIN
jgi:hypothetical protein